MVPLYATLLVTAIAVLLWAAGRWWARRDSEAEAGLLDGAPDVALITLDPEGTVRTFSRGAEALFGKAASEVVGRRPAESFLSAPEEADLLARVRRVVEGGEALGTRRAQVAAPGARFRETLGTIFPVSRGDRVEVGILYLDTGEAEGVDERRLRAYESVPLGLLRVDVGGRIEAVNRTLALWAGRRAETLEGSDVTRAEFLPEGLRARILEVAGKRPPAAQPDEHVEEELSFVMPSGSLRPLVATLSARPGGGADVVLLDGASRRRLLAERDAAREALASARQTAAQAIESRSRDLTSSVQELMSAVERTREAGAGAPGASAAQAELEASGRRLLAQFHERGKDGPGARPRVLVVDDNDENRNLLAHMLKSRGVDVISVATGREAVDSIARERFDLVLLDVQMPEMDGYDVVRRVRTLPGGERLPVVAITALTSEEVRGRCLAEGMNDFVNKPVSLGKVEELLGKWAGHQVVRPRRTAS